jgi:hypothetical protein
VFSRFLAFLSFVATLSRFNFPLWRRPIALQTADSGLAALVAGRALLCDRQGSKKLFPVGP